MNHQSKLKLLCPNLFCLLILCILTSACGGVKSSKPIESQPSQSLSSINGRWQLQRLSSQENLSEDHETQIESLELSENFQNFIQLLNQGATLTLHGSAGTLSHRIHDDCSASRGVTLTSREDLITLSFAEETETFEGDCSEEMRKTSFGPAGAISTGFAERSHGEASLHFYTDQVSLVFRTVPSVAIAEQHTPAVLTDALTADAESVPGSDQAPVIHTAELESNSEPSHVKTLVSSQIDPQADGAESPLLARQMEFVEFTPLFQQKEVPSSTPLLSLSEANEDATQTSLTVRPHLQEIEAPAAPSVSLSCCSPWHSRTHLY
jgi:hypothetical protein